MTCNTISGQDITLKNVASHYFIIENELNDVGIEQMLHWLPAADFNNHCPSKERKDLNEMSVKDQTFLSS